MKKGLLFTILLVALQCLFITTASAQTTISDDAADISSAIIWDEAHSPYIITDNVTIDTEGSLTIQPGVVVKVSKQKGLYVEGTLNAQGTADKPIVFTDSRDDIGGDTNGDNAATSPSSGYWDGIRVNGTATMDYCNVRYAGNYNEANIYKTGTEPLALTNSTISNSSNDGIRICYSEGETTINNCTIKDNKRYGVYVEDIEIIYSGTGNAFSNNGKAPVCIDGGTLYHNITWNIEGSPYYVSSNVSVDETAVLTVDPGVVVKFAKDRGLYNDGTLNANGSSKDGDTIYFTEYRDDVNGVDTNGDGSATKPTAGSWDGIKISNAGNATLRNCVIRYAGHYNECGIYKTGTGLLTLSDSTICNSSNDGIRICYSEGESTINDCTIKDNKRYGVYVENVEEIYSGNGNIFSNNNKAPICIDGGTLEHDVAWNSEGSPYYIASNITVDDNAVLTVDPGVIVKFAQSKGLYVTGTLTAKGTSNSKIFFTDYRDDAAGGDTNDNGASTVPAPGWWDGIKVSGSGTATLDNCAVRYAGHYNESIIYKTGIGSLSLTNSDINDSMVNGLNIEYNTGDCTIAKNNIFNNKIGIYCYDSTPVIGGSSVNANRIYQNTDFGVMNESNDIINAKYNWWGDDSGPTYATNPLGKGDKVSNNVDFSNFISENNNPDPTPVTVDLGYKTNILPTKNWTIKFNQKVFDSTSSPNSTVNSQNITVGDDQGNLINVTLTPGSDLKSVIIQAPTGGYVSGETYTIRVKNIQSVSEKVITKQYILKFTVS